MGVKTFNLKLTILGEPAVGKTSLRKRYLGQGFSTEYLATLGADFAIHSSITSGVEIRFQIWDIAGQMKFNTITKSFFIGSQASMVVFDVTNRSIDSVLGWIRELWTFNGKGKIPVVVIGNKIDLRNEVESA
ncbi:MAG TPA: Rab family GTPase, partial [Candidatus Hodarchaeales archaeon]|nr:Rab family GTPase [Candidatus Hodarchaeales archaeon]